MPKQRRNSWDDDDADDREWERHDYDQDDDIDDEDDSSADDDDLLPCPHCGAAIYEQSEKCPKCGEYVDPDAADRGSKPIWIVMTLLMLIAVFLFYALF